MAFDLDTAKQVGGVFTAAVAGMGMIIYKGALRRIRKVEISVDTKASDAEVARQRVHIEELFRGQKALGDETHAGFLQISKEMNTMHLDIIDRIERARG